MIPLSLIATHFVGDFLLQSDQMAVNKSKSWFWLYVHVLVYSLCFLPWGLRFFVATFALHFVTDAITSRITSKLWFVRVIERYNGPGQLFYGAFDCGNRHWFFTVIGLDQLIHYICLALTLRFV